MLLTSYLALVLIAALLVFRADHAARARKRCVNRRSRHAGDHGPCMLLMSIA